jgi:hypothetical protein
MDALEQLKQMADQERAFAIVALREIIPNWAAEKVADCLISATLAKLAVQTAEKNADGWESIGADNIPPGYSAQAKVTSENIISCRFVQQKGFNIFQDTQEVFGSGNIVADMGIEGICQKLRFFGIKAYANDHRIMAIANRVTDEMIGIACADAKSRDPNQMIHVGAVLEIIDELIKITQPPQIPQKENAK